MRGITPQERLEKWNEAICAQKASGLTIKDWCEQNGISPNTYYLRRIRDTMLESSRPRLVEMELPAADLPAGKSAARRLPPTDYHYSAGLCDRYRRGCFPGADFFCFEGGASCLGKPTASGISRSGLVTPICGLESTDWPLSSGKT